MTVPPTPRRVLVTGAAGKLGRVVTARLAASGVEVVAADRVPPAYDVPAGVTAVVGDLTDAATVREFAAGCDGVIHVAKSGGPETDVFAVNTAATFNVLAAAAAEGIGHAAIASSVCAYGTTFAKRAFPFRYAPVDEDHPLAPQDGYSLSKVVDEGTARAFVDGYGMSIVALRFHWLGAPDEVRAAAARLSAGEPGPSRDLWSYIEVNDAARACQLALGVSGGFQALNICAADSLSQVPTEQLLARFYPETVIRSPIDSTASPWSIARAREILDFVPRYSWRECSGEDH